MSTIPLFIFEEHNEAFFVWHYAIAKNLISAKNNILLHVDEHSDMGIPRFNRSIKTLNGDLQDIYQFTYNELTIENFIIPAIYQSIFDQIYWVYQNRQNPCPPSMCVYSHDKQGKSLAAKSTKELNTAFLFNPDYHRAKFQSLKVDNKFPESQTVVLDIDLDYFSCNHKYHNFRGNLEITATQYREFQQDKHQFLRSILGSMVKTKHENGKYFLCFNDFPEDESIPNKLKVSDKEIINRLDKFIDFLRKHKVQPQIIDICRSRLSGFTPDDQWQLIEQNLLARLGELYEIDTIHLEELYFQEKIA